MKTKDLVIVALYSVLISISAQIKIPLGFVPITLQLFIISFGALKLSLKQIQLSILSFILLALLGVSRIGGNASGPQIFLTPTFSFIIGFFFLAYFINKYKNIKGLALAYISLYLVALPILYLYLKYLYEVDINLISLITLYYVPFIIGDILSLTLAYNVSKRVNIRN